jgi:integrase/recombinase XerD
MMSDYTPPADSLSVQPAFGGALVTGGHQVADIEHNAALAYLLKLQSESSRQTMSSFLNNVAKIMGFHSLQVCPWGMLRQHHFHAVLSLLRDAGKAPATINNYLSAMKGVALRAWDLKQIDTDTYQRLKQVERIRGSRIPKGRALAPEEIRALFFTCERDETPLGARDAAMFAILIGCGLRRSEIVSLDLEHYDRNERALKVLGKGNKERLAFLPDGAYRRLETWVADVRGTAPGALFMRIRRHGVLTHARFSSQAVYHILGTRRIEAGIAECAPHDLRRTFASSMLANGEDLITVKDAMGHASLNTTQKYDFRGNERLREASKRLDLG